MATFTHVHSSGRFDAPANEFSKNLKRYLEMASIVTVTEVHKESRETLMRSIGRRLNFGVVTGDATARDDCGIMYDTTEWELIKGFTARILHNGAYRRSDGTSVQGSYAAFAILKHRITGHVILVSVAHLPPTVEGPKGFGSGNIARARAWREAQRNWKRLWNKYARLYKVDGVMIVADWNLNIKRWVVRNFIQALQRGMRPVWGSGPFPRGGTHGPRIIDHTWIRGAVKRIGNPHLLDDDAFADHRPYIESLTLA